MADRIESVEPIGTKTVNAFWDGHDEHGKHVGGFGPIERPEYPPNPHGEALARLRKASAIGLSTAARLLALTPEQLSGIERGRYRFAEEAEWEKAATILRGYR